MVHHRRRPIRGRHPPILPPAVERFLTLNGQDGKGESTEGNAGGVRIEWELANPRGRDPRFRHGQEGPGSS